MNSTDLTPDRRKRIDELLHMIGGLEASILETYKQDDKQFRNALLPLKAKYYERLRRVMYGLPEESSLEAKAKD